MTVQEVAELWRLYTQEPDTSFISNAQLSMMLKMAYREFRGLVRQHNNEFYTTSVVVNATGGSYDLATGTPSIMGPTPTQARLSRLISVADESSASPNLGRIWQAVGSRRALHNGADAPQYLLTGTLLQFAYDGAASALRVTYEPVEDVDWTLLNLPTFIDELGDYHDLISLLAARRYSAIDAASNKNLDIEILTRTNGLMEYLASGRNADNDMIQREEDYNGYGY